MIFFEGGFTYNDLMNMPLTDLNEWLTVANKIAKEQKKAIEESSRRR